MLLLTPLTLPEGVPLAVAVQRTLIVPNLPEQVAGLQHRDAFGTAVSSPLGMTP